MAVLVLAVPFCACGAAAPGVPNFHQVNERIYRGAQPKGEGWDCLAKLGVKTVVDLRRESEHSCKAEQRAVEAAGMHYVNVPLSGAHAHPMGKSCRCSPCWATPETRFSCTAAGAPTVPAR